MKVKFKPQVQPTETMQNNVKQRIAASPQTTRKSIITKALNIVLEDIKRFFHKDTKSQEDRMRYEAFMEMCRK